MVPLGTSLTCVQSPHEGDSIFNPVPSDSSIGGAGSGEDGSVSSDESEVFGEGAVV